MRPGDFSPGNVDVARVGARHQYPASMRPGDFSPGNLPSWAITFLPVLGFNEAGGFLPRKLMTHM